MGLKGFTKNFVLFMHKTLFKIMTPFEIKKYLCRIFLYFMFLVR